MVYLRQLMFRLIPPGWDHHPCFSDKGSEAQENSGLWSGLHCQPWVSCDGNLDLSDPESTLPLPWGMEKRSWFILKWEIHSELSWVEWSSVTQSCLTLQPHGLQHTRPPCPSPTPRVDSNSCPLSQRCHSAISSSVIPISSHLQSFPASGSFPMSQFFKSGGQSIGASVSASVLPMNIQDWSPLGWTGWIPLQSKGPSRVFSNTTLQKHQFFSAQPSSQSNSHIHTWSLEKS